jgi:hypothetical protein
MNTVGIESLLVSIALLIAVLSPQFGSLWIGRFEGTFANFARRRTTSVLVCGATALLLRAALLPIMPVPVPFIQDEFSYLLAADTFAHRRLTNPPHPMWIHLETFHVIFHPTYASKFPPLQGLLLAASQVVARSPFWGVWFSIGFMCAAICWMLQGWLPSSWAFVGGLLAAIRFGVFSYWDNSYWGGALAAAGGCLVMGALPRIMRRQRRREIIAMALGMGILANTRPYEGFVLSLTALAALAWCMLRSRNAPTMARFAKTAAPGVLLLILIGAGMSYYFWRVTGNPFRMPYTINQQQYSAAGYFVWQSPKPIPVYHHKIISDFYLNAELPHFVGARSVPGFLRETALKIFIIWAFYIGPALTIPLFSFTWALRDRRIRLLLIATVTSFVACSVFPFFYAHYFAPVAGCLLALILQSARHQRQWLWDGRSVGLFLARAAVAICCVMVPIQIAMLYAQARSGKQGPEMLRENVLRQLSSLPGQQLAIVKYSSSHALLAPDWVDNGADIDSQKLIWARDMGPEQNEELLRYYSGRTAWLVQPDATPPRVTRYSAELATATCNRHNLQPAIDLTPEAIWHSSRTREP